MLIENEQAKTYFRLEMKVKTISTASGLTFMYYDYD